MFLFCQIFRAKEKEGRDKKQQKKDTVYSNTAQRSEDYKQILPTVMHKAAASLVAYLPS